ncbi:MAG: hypothetical protein ACK55K_04370, partial [Bacteroidota bacterium]
MLKYLKLFLIGLAGLFIMFTLIGLIMPSSVKVSRGVIVDAQTTYVNKIICDFKTWPDWMVWMRAEEGSLVTSVQEPDIIAMRWRSLKQKEAGQITLLSCMDQLISLRHNFPGLNSSEGAIRIRQINANQTEILWMLEYPLKWYPWERFEGIFIDAIIG